MLLYFSEKHCVWFTLVVKSIYTLIEIIIRKLCIPIQATDIEIIIMNHDSGS